MNNKIKKIIFRFKNPIDTITIILKNKITKKFRLIFIKNQLLKLILVFII